jgi:hypothetical protein
MKKELWVELVAGVKWTGYELDHTVPSSTQDNYWNDTSNSSICVHWVHRKDFTLQSRIAIFP